MTTPREKPKEHTDVKVVGYLMVVLALLLITLSPWRGDSTGLFSQLSPEAFRGYGGLLAVLLVVTFVNIYFVTKYRKGAFIAAIVVGLVYILVYVLDLARVAPISPSPIPQTALIEVVGCALSFFMLLACVNALKRFKHTENQLNNEQTRGKQ